MCFANQKCQYTPESGTAGEVVSVAYRLLRADYALLWLGSFGGSGVIGHPWDTVVVAVMSLGIYYWGERTCLPQANFTGDEEE